MANMRTDDMEPLYRYTLKNWPAISALFADCMLAEIGWSPIVIEGYFEGY